MNAVAAARADWQGWRSATVRDRVRALRRLRAAIVEELPALVRALGPDAGRPELEVLTNELIPTLELIRYYERDAERILAPERRPGRFLFRACRFSVEYLPRGVVVVLGPANLPFNLTLSPVITAFVAGNAVVAKVSEHWASLIPVLTRLVERAAFPLGAVRFTGGGPEEGEALVRARPELVFLTGGVATGKRVMALAAENLTPLILELGGKDASIVFADASFERAVNGVVYGAFANAGQVCVAGQRVYVERPMFERFVAAVADEARSLRRWPRRASDLGALVSESQARRFAAFLDDALAQGARLHTARDQDGRRVAPAVLTQVTPTMRILREETSGPAVSLLPFDSEDEVVELANDSDYGLGASVWTSDLDRGRRVASRLEVGSVAINDVLKNVGHPGLPFGGVKASGFGVARGPEGLRACCRALSVMVNESHAVREPNWFPYRRAKRRTIELLIRLLYADSSWLERWRILRKRWRWLWRERAPASAV